MFNKLIGSAVAVAVVLSAGSALAGNPNARLMIEQADGQIWIESLSGLLVVDAQDNFSMRQGTGTSGLFQNGQFVDSVNTASADEFWQWKSDAATGKGYWNWHTALTVSGATAATATDPWMSTLRLNNVSGHGDPDLTYAVSASNNNTSTQTYTFVVGESIFPTVSTASTVYADIAGALVTRDGNVTISPFGANTAIQKFELSADNGLTFVNSGVDVGPQLSAGSTVTYGTFSDLASGPTGQTWNYMQTVTKFTLTGKDSASLVGFASITPVPEPESFAMMLAGLGLMGSMVYRRKNRAE